MSSKETNLKEKFKIALNSTAKVISDDFNIKTKYSEDKKTKDFISIEIDDITNPSDFIRLRAETDSGALKKKFSDDLIYTKNLPNNTSSRSLYNIAEKIRYEVLGGKMLKGIEKNFNKNYSQIINRKRKDQLKTKEDVPVAEAFELYMLKNFHKIKLNSLTSRMLNFWENEFDKSIEKHKEFLVENLENQQAYSSKFTQILNEMDIFQSEEDNEKEEQNQDQGQDNPSNDDQSKDNEDNKDENNDQETQATLDADYNIDEFNLDEQLPDVESDEQSSEQIIKKNIDNINLDYKIFTFQFDEIIKAENLENAEEASKLRKSLDQQLIGFQDIITKLANSKNPVSYVGGGILLSGASNELREFIEFMGLPVAHSLMGKGAISDENPYLLGMTGFWGTKLTNDACLNADYILAIGTRFKEADCSSWYPGF